MMDESENIHTIHRMDAGNNSLLHESEYEQISHIDPFALVHIEMGRRSAFKEAATITESLVKFADREGVRAVYESLAAIFFEMGRK